VIISSTNKEGIIEEVSEAFCKISGYSKEELIGKSHNIVRHEDMSKEVYENMWKDLSAGKVWKGEIKNKNKKGDTYWVEAIIQPNYENDNFVGYTAIRTNITNKKIIEHLSITDELTQMYNRRYFNKIIEEELNRRKREKTFISFMMIDIDYFKKYNDTYGHQAGDKALQNIASVFKMSSKRSGDFVFRLGGEEFAMIFYAENKDKALDFATSIKEEIEGLKIEHKTSDVSEFITVSIGLIYKNSG
jgi:diguanylate cyclase (GGDEF)-like protein/PAS domain S-box-containing protein